MKEKLHKTARLQQDNDNGANLMLKMVKWTENGILQLGTVMEIYSLKGIKYLTVMTIFGKRCRVKMSKVKLASEPIRA